MPKLRILLDECVDRRLAAHIADHSVKTVPQMGWAGLKNGELLEKAQPEFDVFVTTDRNLSFQQNLSQFDIAVAVLSTTSNRLNDLVTVIPALLEALPGLPPGEATAITE